MPEKTAESILDTESLLTRIRLDFPDLSFVESSNFSWHAKQRRVSFQKSSEGPKKYDSWSILHELGHALLGHTTYRYDIELLRLEVAAWEKACDLATSYNIDINHDYVQDCLDTYRDWLHLRSTCPSCFVRSLQASPSHYHCFNCGADWQVSRSRLCRPYRLKTT